MDPFEPNPSSRPGRRGRSRTACAQCRRSKVRCGLERMPCSRCHRLGLECSWDTTPLGVEVRNQALEARSVLSDSQSQDTNRGTGPIQSESGNPRSASYDINDLSLSQEQVDQMFQLFFQKFHPYLPFLDPDRTADEYFKTSRFLSWAIVSVAARERHDASQILAQCHPLFAATIGGLLVGGRHNHVQLYDIQALILLALWPWQNVYWWTDRSWTLSNVAVTLATQIGLHFPLSSGEYAMRINGDSLRVRRERSHTWYACIAVAQNMSTDFGHFSNVSAANMTWSQASEHEAIPDMPEDLQHFLLIQRVSHSAHALFDAPDCAGKHDSFSENLIVTLPECETRLSDLTTLEMSLFNRMNFVAADMHIKSLWFQVAVSHLHRRPGILRAYFSATQIIELAISESRVGTGKSSMLYHAPRTLLRMLSFAAMLIFRVLFSQYRDEVSYEVGKLLFNAAASTLRHSSLRFLDHDAPIRFAKALKILWEYGEKNPTLLESPPVLLVRTRGGASLVYDCLAMIRHPLRPSYDIEHDVPPNAFNPPGQRVLCESNTTFDEDVADIGLFSFGWIDDGIAGPLL